MNPKKPNTKKAIKRAHITFTPTGKSEARCFHTKTEYRQIEIHEGEGGIHFIGITRRFEDTGDNVFSKLVLSTEGVMLLYAVLDLWTKRPEFQKEAQEKVKEHIKHSRKKTNRHARQPS